MPACEAALKAAHRAETSPRLAGATGEARQKKRIERWGKTPLACAKMFCAEGAKHRHYPPTHYAPIQIAACLPSLEKGFGQPQISAPSSVARLAAWSGGPCGTAWRMPEPPPFCDNQPATNRL